MILLESALREITDAIAALRNNRKLISGIIAIGSGFPLGPEGPSVQMGGSVAWQMAKWLKAPTAFRRVIVAAGGGAGIAAVFSAPLGGFVYAIEELLNSARPVILLLVVITKIGRAHV